MLQHVGIEIEPGEVEAAVSFFELLGFERVDPPPALRRYTWVEREGTQVHLMPEASPTVPRHGHIALVVEDYEGTLARLRERGFEVEPGDEPWGAPRTKVLAPGGQLVELMSAPPTTR
jgi:hypothetical protein